MDLSDQKLSRAQERQCLRMGWWQKLVECNLRESVIYLKSISRGRFSEGELISFAYDGMVQAWKNFDPVRNRFFTWAKPHIRGKMFVAMRDQSRYSEMMGREVSGGEMVTEDPETGEKVESWTNEPSVDFDHDSVHYKSHYYEEIHGVMKRVLKPQEQRVITDRVWHGLRYREIGEKYGFSTSRAQAIFERAMQLVRRELMRRNRLYEDDSST